MQNLLSGGVGRRWRQTDATMEVESVSRGCTKRYVGSVQVDWIQPVQCNTLTATASLLASPQIGGNSLSSSVERQAMRDQLDAVRQTLNSLACVSQTNAAGVNAAAAGIDVALADIANKLASIEGLYVSLTNKLEKVDLRVEDSERHIKDLQHFSASAIHETARLVRYRILSTATSCKALWH